VHAGLGLYLILSGPATGLAFLAIAIGISFVLRGIFLAIVAIDLRKVGI